MTCAIASISGGQGAVAAPAPSDGYTLVAMVSGAGLGQSWDLILLLLSIFMLQSLASVVRLAGYAIA